VNGVEEIHSSPAHIAATGLRPSASGQLSPEVWPSALGPASDDVFDPLNQGDGNERRGLQAAPPSATA
jgi:hypothetical protein